MEENVGSKKKTISKVDFSITITFYWWSVTLWWMSWKYFKCDAQPSARILYDPEGVIGHLKYVTPHFYIIMVPHSALMVFT